MLRNGSYSAWFRTQRGEGTGIVELKDGKVTGGDTVLAYTGSYVEDGDAFTALIATERHSPGHPSVFGIDNVELTLSGNSSATTTASCTGTVKQVPGMTFEAVLIRIADQPRESLSHQRVGGPTAPGAATGHHSFLSPASKASVAFEIIPGSGPAVPPTRSPLQGHAAAVQFRTRQGGGARLAHAAGGGFAAVLLFSANLIHRNRMFLW